MNQRITYLDGHRGLAIIMVILYHAFVRWPDHVPYGDSYQPYDVFYFGPLGVQLFFLLSGFVIFMSLERTTNPALFLYKRWLRLFPAMLICSLIVFFSTGFFHERPLGEASASQLIPGLTFIGPGWWNALLGIQLSSLEGPFWTIYVEVQFYVIAALLSLWLSKEKMVFALLALFILSFATPLLAEHYSQLAIAHKLTETMGLKHFGWFAAGAAFYLFMGCRLWRWYILGCICMLLSSLQFLNREHSLFIVALAVSAFFAASLVYKPLQRLLENKLLQLLGFVSYPLYLLHENMMISMITKLDTLWPWLPDWALVGISVTILVGGTFVIAKYLEKPCKVTIEKGLRFLFKRTIK